MSTIVNIPPAGTVITNTSNIWKDNTGAIFTSGDLSKLGDFSGSTFARNTSGLLALLTVELSTYVLDPTERVRRVRVGTTQKHTYSTVKFFLSRGGTSLSPATLLNAAAAPSINYLKGPWLSKLSGSNFTQSDIDNLRVNVQAGGAYVDSIVYELYAELDIQSKPVVTPSVPSSNSDGSVITAPTIRWTLADMGDTQRLYRVKVFTAAVAEGMGFDPETTPAVYDSLEMSSSLLSHRINSSPLNGSTDYYAYVKAATDYNGSSWWSEWAGQPFTTATSPTLVWSEPPTSPVTLTLTDAPLISGSFQDPNDKPVESYVLKVFNPAQYGAPGFNPATSPSIYSKSGKSGVDDPTATEDVYQVLPRLPNGVTYRAYVRGTSSEGMNSEWAYREFILDLVQPAAPLVTVVADPGEARVVIYASGSHNILRPRQAQGVDGQPGWVPLVNCQPVTSATISANVYHILKPVANGDLSIILDEYILIPQGPTLVVGIFSAYISMLRAAGVDKDFRIGFLWYDDNNTLLYTNYSATSTTTGLTPTDLYSGAAGAIPSAARKFKLLVNIIDAQVGSEYRLDIAQLTPLTIPSIGLGMGPSFIDAQRSIDGGNTWEQVRGFPNGQPYGMIYDNEAPFNVDLIYRVTSVSRVTGQEIRSSYTMSSVTQLAVPTVWLKDVIYPERNTHFPIEDTWLEATRFRARAIQKGLGASKPKVIRGEGSYEQFTANFVLIGDDQFQRFEELIEGDHVMTLTTGKRIRYVEVSGDYTLYEALWDDLHNRENVWRASIPFVEVEKP